LWTLQNDKAYEVVSLLIHRGATTNGRSSPSETTPLQTVLSSSECDLDDDEEWEPHYRTDALGLVHLLIEAGADVNARPAEGYRTSVNGVVLPVYSYTALQLATTFIPKVRSTSVSRLRLKNVNGDLDGLTLDFTEKTDYVSIVQKI